MDAPSIDGSNWTAGPNRTCSWQNDDMAFVVRPFGASDLRGVHMLQNGRIFTFHVNEGGASADGYQSLYGAAYRKVMGRTHPTDVWVEEQFPSILHGMFFAQLGR